MKPLHYIRNSLLTGVCVGLMTGCSWFDDWPPQGSEMARKTAPKSPESKIKETSGGTWLDRITGGDDEPEAEMAQARGIAIDDASSDRIAELEQQVQQLSNDISMIMPALTKMAEAQGSMQKSLSGVEPAAGMFGGSVVQDYQQSTQMVPAELPQDAQQNQQITNQTTGPAPGTVAWYEEQERIQRRAEREERRLQRQGSIAADNGWQPPAPPPMAPQQMAQYGQQQYTPPQQQQSQYNQQPAYYNQQQPDYPPQTAYQQPAAYQPPQQTYESPPQQQRFARYEPPQQMQQASYGGSGSSVTNVRFGEHPDKTRLVLDTSDKVSFSYDIDNSERILMIDLPGTGWLGAPQMQISNSPLVESYNVIPDNQGGHQVIMQLKQPARVLWSQALAPGGVQGHRIVFDLAPM